MSTEYNSILIVVNKFIKYIYLILYLEFFKAKKIVQIILDKIIRYYGISGFITLNKDKIFISKF